VHSIDWAALATGRKEFFTPHSASHNVADQRVALWQISSEVHFLPFVVLLYAKTREPKIRANRISSHKIHLAICKEYVIS